MKDEIYQMFKDGKNTTEIYNTFLSYYEQAKSRYNQEQKEAKKKEAARKQSAARKVHLPRFRTELVDAIFNYVDFLFPDIFDYDECIKAVEDTLLGLENVVDTSTLVAEGFVDRFINTDPSIGDWIMKLSKTEQIND